MSSASQLLELVISKRAFCPARNAQINDIFKRWVATYCPCVVKPDITLNRKLCIFMVSLPHRIDLWAPRFIFSPKKKSALVDLPFTTDNIPGFSDMVVQYTLPIPFLFSGMSSRLQIICVRSYLSDCFATIYGVKSSSLSSIRGISQIPFRKKPKTHRINSFLSCLHTFTDNMESHISGKIPQHIMQLKIVETP